MSRGMQGWMLKMLKLQMDMDFCVSLTTYLSIHQSYQTENTQNSRLTSKDKCLTTVHMWQSVTQVFNPGLDTNTYPFTAGE